MWVGCPAHEQEVGIVERADDLRVVRAQHTVTPPPDDGHSGPEVLQPLAQVRGNLLPAT